MRYISCNTVRSALIKLKVLLVGFFILSANNPASAEEAYFDGERLIIPTALGNNGQGVFRWELSLSSSRPYDGWCDCTVGSEPIGSSPLGLWFSFASWTRLSWWWDPDHLPSMDNPAMFYGGGVFVPRVNVGGNYFWLRFSWPDVEPASLELIEFGIDDQDDDDDGIPDLEDDDQWSPVSSEDPWGIAGLWTFRFDQNSAQTGTLCEQIPTLTYYDIEIFYDRETERYWLSSGGESVMTEPLNEEFKSSRTVGFDASYSTGEGVIDAEFELFPRTSQLIGGHQRWSWNGGDSGSCNNMVSWIDAVKK